VVRVRATPLQCGLEACADFDRQGVHDRAPQELLFAKVLEESTLRDADAARDEGDEGGVGQEASSESRNAMAVAISLTQATAQAE
jgi:hypothetical protein